MVHLAPRAVFILGLLIGAWGVQVQNLQEPEPEVKTAKLQDYINPAIKKGFAGGVLFGGIMQLYKGWRRCQEYSYLADVSRACEKTLNKCIEKNEQNDPVKSEAFCKADLYNEPKSGCKVVWEFEDEMKEEPWKRDCVGPYEINKRSVANWIWGGIGTIPGLFVGISQFWSANLEACKKNFDLEGATQNNTDFDFNDFSKGTWWVQRQVKEDQMNNAFTCRKLTWQRLPSKSATESWVWDRERDMEFKCLEDNKDIGCVKDQTFVYQEKGYHRCLKHNKPGGIMTYGGCWENGQSEDYWIPYYNKSTGIAIVFQGQPSNMNKKGLCRYMANKKARAGHGMYFDRGTGVQGLGDYREFERAYWILSRTATADATVMTSAIELIRDTYKISVDELMKVENAGCS